METPIKPPSVIKAKIVEQRAEFISDPVAKLRFIRRETARVESTRWGKFLDAHKPKVTMSLGVAAAGLVIFAIASSQRSVKARSLPAVAYSTGNPSAHEPGSIWMVDIRDGQEIYSNSLRIETRFTIPLGEEPTWKYNRYTKGSKTPVEMKDPVGIVFHTTEGLMAPFEKEQNGRLKFIGESQVRLVRSIRAYHYVVDRFGQVWRVVQESEPAFHSGNSIWADKDWVYMNLNHSFLAVSFEARTQGEGEAFVTEAQKLSGKLLTDMLRAKYHIPFGNLVTHGQVSVNPDNYGIGYHTDFGGEFPFTELGLPDNYQLPPPSMTMFGFNYDETYLAAMGDRVVPGLAKAEDMLNSQAKAQGITPALLTRRLRAQYRQIFQNLKKDNKNEVSN